MRKFENPTMEIDKLDLADIITASVTVDNCPNKLPDDE